MASLYGSVSSTSVCTLDLACNIIRLTVAIKPVPDRETNITTLKASVSMAENIIPNSVGACLTSFVNGNGVNYSRQSEHLPACHHEIGYFHGYGS